MTLPPQTTEDIPLVEHFAHPVKHCERGEIITSYEKLATDQLTKEKWTTEIDMESGNIAERHKATNTPGRNEIS